VYGVLIFMGQKRGSSESSEPPAAYGLGGSVPILLVHHILLSKARLNSVHVSASLVCEIVVGTKSPILCISVFVM